jgi:hypothetical protein
MNMTPRSVARGSIFAIGSFLALGTVTALWPNPFFIRMTPTGSFEVALLAAQSMLLGVYLAIPVAACATKLAGTGGVANFLGIACPICNKVLVLLFGAQALLTYLEPARIYLAAAGALITGIAVIFRWRRFRAAKGGSVLAAHATS